MRVNTGKVHLPVAAARCAARQQPTLCVVGVVNPARGLLVQNLASILKKPGVRKKPYLVRGRDEVITAARNITTDSLAPIFLTSAVTGARVGVGGRRVTTHEW